MPATISDYIKRKRETALLNLKETEEITE